MIGPPRRIPMVFDFLARKETELIQKIPWLDKKKKRFSYLRRRRAAHPLIRNSRKTVQRVWNRRKKAKRKFKFGKNRAIFWKKRAVQRRNSWKNMPDYPSRGTLLAVRPPNLNDQPRPQVGARATNPPRPNLDRLMQQLRQDIDRLDSQVTRRRLIAHNKDLLMSDFMMESGYRTLMRVISYGVLSLILVAHLLNLKTRFNKNPSNPYQREGRKSPHMLVLQVYCVVKIIEELIASIEFIHYYRIKKRALTEEYVHTVWQVLMHLILLFLFRRFNLLTLIPIVVDLVVKVVLIVVYFKNEGGEVGDHRLSVNTLCFIPIAAIQIMGLLKLEGILGSWFLAMIPLIIFSCSGLLLGGVLIYFYTKAYKDCLGKKSNISKNSKILKKIKIFSNFKFLLDYAVMFSFTAGPICGIAFPILVDRFEKSGSMVYPTIASLLIGYVCYAYAIIYFLYVTIVGEELFHFYDQKCILGDDCKFKWRYEKLKRKILYRRFMNKEEATKVANKYYRESDTLLKSKSGFFGGSNLSRVETAKATFNPCYICFEKPAGAAFLPCLHTGVCAGCAIKLLKKPNFFEFRAKFRCPMCKKVPDKFLFYEQVEGSRKLKGVGFEEVRKKIGLDDKTFEAEYLT